MQQKSTVLVTGAVGSVGRRVCDALYNKGYSVKAFDLPKCDFSAIEEIGGIEIIKGDISSREDVTNAVNGVDAVVHLAALMPPACLDRDKVFAINVHGTKYIVDAIKDAAANKQIHLVFSSSVSTYGDTTKENPPIGVSHPQQVLDYYAESKIECEKLIASSSISYTILRIAAIAIPEFLDPPDPWTFMPKQRVEFVNCDDVVSAILGSIEKKDARNKVFNIAGGATWQMLGDEYVKQVHETMTLTLEDANFKKEPGWLDWYDTTEAQAILGYQNTSFADFIKLLRKATIEAIGEELD